MPVIFSTYNRKLSEIVTKCELGFRLNFALNGGHIGHYFIIQPCESKIVSEYDQEIPQSQTADIHDDTARKSHTTIRDTRKTN